MTLASVLGPREEVVAVERVASGQVVDYAETRHRSSLVLTVRE